MTIGAAPLRALLVGAGHAHLHVIDQAAALRRSGVALVVVAPTTFHYSGVASASATGALPWDHGAIDVGRLARRRGVPHHATRVVDIDLDRPGVTTEEHTTVGFDVVSFNIGSVAATQGMQVAPDVLAAKPLAQLGELAAWLDQHPPDRRVSVGIVGGGSTGLELAGNLAARTRPRVRVRIYERAPRPGSTLPEGARVRAIRRLHHRGVDFRAGVPVDHVTRDHVTVEGRRHDHDLVILATGLAAHPLVADLGLGDHRGMPVRSTLQHVDHETVHAVGDCAHFRPRPLPMLGVFGVRQGPVLAASLQARASGEALPTYEPQQDALQILDLGGRRGLAVRGRWWAEGRLPLLAKRVIDRRWLRRYQVP